MQSKWRLRLFSYTFIFCLVSPPTFATGGVAHKDDKLHPDFTSLEFNGQPYQYYERKSHSGKVIGQYLIGKERTEIMLDNNGDGTLDSWEIFTQSGKILMSQPRFGHFQHMDMDVMTKKGVVRYAYAWNAKRKLFALYSARARPYLKYSYESELIVNCLSGPDGLKLEKLSESLNAALNRGDQTDELKNQLKSSAMDASCKTGAYAQSTDDIVAGMMAVATSEKDGGWNAAVADDAARPAERGMYLQCMRHMGLFAQAARIEAAMAQYTSLVPTDKYQWKLTCSAKPNQEFGNFIEAQASVPPTIEIHATADQMKTFLKNANPTEEQVQGGYGRLFFHEMLHYSMMSEDDAHGVENCCAEPTEGPAKEQACSDMQTRAQIVEYKQGYSNLIEKSLGTDGLAVLHDTLAKSFGDNDADAYFDETLKDLGKVYNGFENSSACKVGVTNDKPLGNCDAQYKAKVEAIIQSRFGTAKGSVCRDDIDPAIKADEAAQICGTTAGILESIINKKGAPCTKAIKQIKTEAKNDFGALKFFESFTHEEIASAATSDDIDTTGTAAQRLCSVAEHMTITQGTDNLNNYSSNASNVIPDAWMPGLATDTFSNPKSTNTALKPTAPNGKTSFDANSGPERPIFANDTTTRSKEIANHIANSDSLIKNFQTYANRSVDSILPRAQAEPSTPLANQVVKAADVQTTYLPQPKIAVPDPLGALGASGPGGSALPSRAPASVGSSQSRLTGSSGSGQGPATALPATRGDGHAIDARIDTRTVINHHLPHGVSPSQVAGLANPQATANGKRTPVNLAEERARKSLLLFLKNKDYENKVKPELVRPSVQAALLDHKIQVVDEDGKVFGSGFPEAKLIYDLEKRYLVDAPSGSK